MILSKGLDTNGQNARYVEAARKHGGKKAVLHALAIGKSDPAGVVTRFRLAADKYKVLNIREAHRQSAYFEFPTDIVWTRKTEREIKNLAAAADVVHLNNSEIAYRLLQLKKPALLHHHGSLFRNNPQRMLDIAQHHRMVQATSTIDLLRFAPDKLTWLPSAYDIDAMQEFAKQNARPLDGRVLIVHCPTNRELKHTSVLIEAVSELQKEGLPVDLELVEGRPWRESLAAKARADIVFDQLLWGYGCNGIEAWGMGKPVVAGADDWTLAEMRRQWGTLPFFPTTEQGLVSDLREFVIEEVNRQEFAEIGLAHVRTYHDELPALTKLAELYEDAIATYHRPRIAGKGPSVTFIKKKGGSVYDLDGEPIPFVNGKITTNDPMTVQRLRTLAKRSQRFGITEEEKSA